MKVKFLSRHCHFGSVGTLSLIIGAILSSLIQSAQATILLTEDFSYSDGPLDTVSGGAWGVHSGTGGQTVSGGALFIDNIASGADVNRSLGTSPVVSAGVIYAGFDLTVPSTALPTVNSTTETYISHFGQNTSGTGYVSRLLLNAGTEVDTYKIGILRGSGTGASGTFFGTELEAGVTYRIVHAFDL